MKIAVTGGSGFIASRFIEMYQNKFDLIKVLNSKNAPLDNFNNILESTKDVDIIIHSAFDHSYKNNIIGIKNILKACKVNGIKKLIHMSTVSVYDLNIQGKLSEESIYSNLSDPYSKEKRKIEYEINKYRDLGIDIIILQPTIVYGLGGNWTKYALHACKSKVLKLPSSGERICNAVYVDDVATAIYNASLSRIKYGKFLVSSNEEITWKKFYQAHCQVLKELKVFSMCDIKDSLNNNEFHTNYIINFIFNIWFKTPFGSIFYLIISFLKKLRAKQYSSFNSKNEFKVFIKSKLGENILEPSGITKKLHDSNFKVSNKNSIEILKYSTKFTLVDGMNKLKSDIKEIIN